jgi:CIC family chloride channel protein
MAILMIFEMTWSPAVLLPLVLACIVGYFVALPGNNRAMYGVVVEHRRSRETRGRLSKLCVRDLVKPAETVLPLTAPFSDIVRMLREHAVKFIYVVNDAGWFIGVVRAQDVTSAMVDNRDTASLTAADLLHQEFLILTEDQSLGEALQVFLKHQGERLPVVPSEQQPVLLGVVHKTALLDTYYHLHQPLL